MIYIPVGLKYIAPLTKIFLYINLKNMISFQILQMAATVKMVSKMILMSLNYHFGLFIKQKF